MVKTSVGLLKKDEDAIAGNGAANAYRGTKPSSDKKRNARPDQNNDVRKQLSKHKSPLRLCHLNTSNRSRSPSPDCVSSHVPARLHRLPIVIVYTRCSAISRPLQAKDQSE